MKTQELSMAVARRIGVSPWIYHRSLPYVDLTRKETRKQVLTPIDEQLISQIRNRIWTDT